MAVEQTRRTMIASVSESELLEIEALPRAMPILWPTGPSENEREQLEGSRCMFRSRRACWCGESKSSVLHSMEAQAQVNHRDELRERDVLVS